ncbi:hypothetical protein TcCL_ESM09495, partial [Trypanosoma cruzi]
SKINTDIPRDAKISAASTGLLSLCHRRRNTAQCTHLFSSCSVSRLVHTFSDGLTPTKARHKSHCDHTSSCDERLCVHGSAAHTCWHDRLQPVPSCQSIGSSMGKRKWPIPRVLIPTGSANTLVASRHSSAHPGMLKSNVEPSASNATIPAHMSAPPEKTHKPHTKPLTCFPNIIPTHRDMPNRSIRHSMHLPTQSNSPCTTHGSSSHPSKQVFLGPVLSTCCSGLPRLKGAAVGNIVRDHSPQRGRLPGDCATSVGLDSTGAGARRAQPAVAHRQRCRTQLRCQSGLRESGDGDGAARDAAPATLTLHSDALAQPSCRFVSDRRHHVGDRASWR